MTIIKLEEYSEEFRHSILSIFDIYFLISEDTTVLDFNSKIEKLYLPPEQFLNKKLADILPEDLKENVLEVVNEMFTTKQPQILEYSLPIEGFYEYFEAFFLFIKEDRILILVRDINNRKKTELDLEKERKILENIIEHNPYAMQIYDNEGNQLGFNKALVELFGSAPPDKYNFYEDPAHNSQDLEVFNSILNGQNMYFPDLYYNRHDVDSTSPDKDVWFNGAGFPVLNANGEVERVIVMYQDITEKKIAEQELEKEKILLENIIKLNPYAIQVFDNKGNHINYNKAHTQLFQSIPPDDYNYLEDPDHKKTGTDQIFRKVLEGEKFFVPDVYYNRHNVDPTQPDKDVWMNVSVFPVFNAKGEVERVVGMYQDITERKKTEQELEKERKILKQIIDLNPYGIQIFDNKGYIDVINQAGINLFGIAPPKDYNVYDDPNHQRTEDIKNFNKLMAGEKVYMPDNWYNRHDVDPTSPDKPTCTNITGFPVFNSKGEVEKGVFMFEDITERKLAQNQLEELKKELEIRVKDRTFKLESSEKKFKKAYKRANCYKGLFTHDISNIFQIVSNSLELCQMTLDKDGDKEEIKKLYETMENQINRGMKMVFNIKNLSEIEDTEMPIIRTSIVSYLQNAIDFVNENFQNREISVNLNLPTDEVMVLANDLLLDVFENILINAVRYNKNPTAEIQVIVNEYIEEDNEFIKFEFTDNGVGIENSRKPTIFERKYENIRERKGMGLGLSLVAEILDLYEGKIWVEDRVEGDHTQGSNFIFLIPKAG